MDNRVKNRQVKKILFTEGTANLIVVILKAAVGITTGAVVIISDALHSLADLINNIVGLIAIHISNKPPDDDHPYGHQKFETLAVFFLAVLLAVIAIQVALHAIQRESAEVISHSWGLAVMICVLIINISVTAWEGHWAKKLNSDILRADSSHTFADVLLTIVVIFGWQVSSRGYYWLDSAFSLLVSAFIFYLAFLLLKRAIPVLVDRIAIDPDELNKIVQGVRGVKYVVKARSRGSGDTISIDVTVRVDAKLSHDDAHKIADSIENTLQKKYSVEDIIVHTEPDS